MYWLFTVTMIPLVIAVDIGNSNITGWQIADTDGTARSQGLYRFATAQNNYSLLERRVEREVLPACERCGLSMQPFFPVASGMLTGKYRRNDAPPADTRLANAGTAAARALSERNVDRVEALAVSATRVCRASSLTSSRNTCVAVAPAAA